MIITKKNQFTLVINNLHFNNTIQSPTLKRPFRKVWRKQTFPGSYRKTSAVGILAYFLRLFLGRGLGVNMTLDQNIHICVLI